MARDHGRFVWFELITAHAEEAKSFYPEVFGWRIEEMEMPGGIIYPLIKVGEAAIGGFAPPPKKGMTPHWVSYVSVADVDATAKKVLASGGKSLMDAFDVPGVGRMQPVTDKEGAAFFLFKTADGDPTPADGPGSFHWNELWSNDPKAAVKFYEAVLGYTSETMEMPNGTYYVLKSGDQSRGGVMATPAPDAPAHFRQYVTVEDCDATLERAKRSGGKPVGELMDVPGVGRFGHLQDNQGATIGFIEPAAK